MAIEQSPPPECNENKDVHVDITGYTNSNKDFMVSDSCDDDDITTECSSSFADTGSGSENAVFHCFAHQQLHDTASSPMSDIWHQPLLPRKKKVTDHWRKSIEPIMRRCKWIELQMIKLQSQARKYVEELDKLDYTKQLDYAHLAMDDSDIKSVPISGRMHRNKVIKRRKRKRVEDNSDIASYMSNHYLFSYYEKEDRNVDVGLNDCHHEATLDVQALSADSGNAEKFKSNGLWSSADNHKSWDDIIQEIEALQSQVQILKNKHDKVISENQRRFCSANQLSMVEPSNGLDHFNLNPDSFAGNASSPNVIVPLIEATDRPKLDDPLENTMDEDHTQYEVSEEEWDDIEKMLEKIF